MSREENAKLHKGKAYTVEFVGGEYHGEFKQLRSPIPATHEVAKPSPYLGGGHYGVGIGYETYKLMWYKDQPYFVFEFWTEDFALNPDEVLARQHKSSNAKKFEEEINKETAEAKELERQKELARKDFDEVGIAIEYQGKRLDPREVRIFFNANHLDAQKWLKFKRDKI